MNGKTVVPRTGLIDRISWLGTDEICAVALNATSPIWYPDFRARVGETEYRHPAYRYHPNQQAGSRDNRGGSVDQPPRVPHLADGLAEKPLRLSRHQASNRGIAVWTNSIAGVNTLALPAVLAAAHHGTNASASVLRPTAVAAGGREQEAIVRFGRL